MRVCRAMKFKIKDIEGDGIGFHEEMSHEVIGTREDDQLRFVAPVSVEGHISKLDSLVMVECHVSGRLSGLCAYTMAITEQDFDHDIRFDFDVEKRDQEIDLEEDLRQEIMIGLPLRVESVGGRAKALSELEKKKTFFNINDSDLANKGIVKDNDTHQPFKDLDIDLTD
ncbi:MAG: hypothetical protein ACI9F2_000446 [Lysobacterales bacterium]|jgi:hypothetical protein